MRSWLLLLFFACSLHAAELQIIMNKGSEFKGVSDIKVLNVLTDYGMLRVPIGKVIRSVRKKDQTKIQLTDGTVIFGHFQMTHLKIRTAIGEFTPEIKQIDEIKVVKNTGRTGDSRWIEPVKGLTMRLLKYEHDLKDKQVRMRFEVKNISSKIISLRAPEINSNAFSDNGNSLFRIRIRNNNGMLYKMQMEELQRVASNVLLSPGKSFTVDLTLNLIIMKVNQIDKSEFLLDKIDEQNIKLTSYTGELPKGEHQIHLRLVQYYHNGAWIHASDYKDQTWNGVLKLQPLKLLIK